MPTLELANALTWRAVVLSVTAMSAHIAGKKLEKHLNGIHIRSVFSKLYFALHVVEVMVDIELGDEICLCKKDN